MKLAVVGATGMVGTIMIKLLEERKFPISELVVVASKNSIGNPIRYQDRTIKIIGLEEAVLKKPDIAIFSAGSAVSLEWAPKFAESGTVVIDNSSALENGCNKKINSPRN